MRGLTSDKKICYTVSLVTLAVLLLSLLIPPSAIRWGAAVALMIAALATCVFIQKRSIHSFNKRQILLILSVSAVLCVVIYYVFGLSVGYTKLYRAFSAETLFKIIIPIALIILASETVRSVLLAQADKLAALAAFLVGVLSEIFIGGGFIGVGSGYALVDFLGITVFPAITANVLYNYVSKRYGMTPNAVYRLIMSLYMYIIPYVPAVQRILTAFLRLVLPLVLFTFIRALFEKKQRTKNYKKQRWLYLPYAAGILLMTALVMLISCQFRFGAVVIASPSMTGEINKGDTIIYESYEHCEGADVGDVIVFEKNPGKRVVHRIVEETVVDGELRYITKGDANEDIDAGYVTDAQIVGKVRLKVLYVGYPSLWLYEIAK